MTCTEEKLRGREVHFVPVPKTASLDIDLLQRYNYISIIAVRQGGAVQKHGLPLYPTLE